ncbi:hypothetical protein [Stieleria varia]|uniref:Uncharacterized protein n=1 Tax=Stieleria varia TaxID=2528005 RepID=A0A5C5ZQE6_9BACT|nr:hypothetical protein [Stieleria varia]TWT89167.1 hypothetical protein Pla52n_69000 [Stieleria varia]
MSKREEFEQWLEDNFERQTWQFPGSSSYTVYRAKPASAREADRTHRVPRPGWWSGLVTVLSSFL